MDGPAAAGRWLMLSVPAHQRRYGPADKLVGHFRRYDPAAITVLLAGCGLTDIEVRQYGFPLGYALEAARNLIGRRRCSPRRPPGPWLSAPPHLAGCSSPPAGYRARRPGHGTAPFRLLQRGFPGTGTGLVVLARLAG